MALPENVSKEFIQSMFGLQRFYKNRGDVDKHYYYSQEGLDYLYQQIIQTPHTYDSIQISQYFSKNANFLPMYFTRVSNLKKMFTQRAAIFSHYLTKNGCQLNYTFPPRSKKRNRIRLGIIKEDYHTSSETLASLPIFEYLDHSQFEIVLFSLQSNQNSINEHYCKSCADRFLLLPQNFYHQINAIRNADLDILFFATNLTASLHRFITYLAFHRLARVQINSICSPVSTGIKNIDYFLSGNLTTPSSEYQNHHSETLITVEGSGVCFHYPYSKANSTIQRCREDWNILKNTIVFISGANIYKIIPEVRFTWAEIISMTENSILVLYPFSPNWGGASLTQSFIDNMKSIFLQYGINEQRLIIEKTLPNIPDVLSILSLADIYLDTFPYTGATSLIDPLTVGLPTVVYEGDSLRARQGASMFREMQLTDLIVSNENEYIQLAIDLANNAQKRKYFVDKIKAKMLKIPPFLNSNAYSKKIGDVFNTLAYQGNLDNGGEPLLFVHQ